MALRRRRKSEDPEDLKSVPEGMDADTFFAPMIPPEVRVAVPLMHDVSQDAFRKVVDGALVVVKQGKATTALLRGLAQSTEIEASNLAALLSGVYTILRHVVKNRVKASDVERDLVEMRVPHECVADIVGAVRAMRPSIEACAISRRIRFPTLQKLKWRVDVIISSSAVARVLKPTLLMQMFLSDGTIKTFEVSVSQFHQLRYTVAKVLQSLGELERHPIMKVISMLDSERKLDA